MASYSGMTIKCVAEREAERGEDRTEILIQAGQGLISIKEDTGIQPDLIVISITIC